MKGKIQKKLFRQKNHDPLQINIISISKPPQAKKGISIGISQTKLSSLVMLNYLRLNLSYKLCLIMLNFFLNFKLNMLISVMLIKKKTCRCL